MGLGEGFRPEALNKAGEGQAWLEGAGLGRPQGERSCVGHTAQLGRVGMSPRSPPVRKAPRNGCLGWARSGEGLGLQWQALCSLVLVGTRWGHNVFGSIVTCVII